MPVLEYWRGERVVYGRRKSSFFYQVPVNYVKIEKKPSPKRRRKKTLASKKKKEDEVHFPLERRNSD